MKQLIKERAARKAPAKPAAPVFRPQCIGCGTTRDVKRDDVYSYYRCPRESCGIF